METHFAIETICARYFDGHAVLFKEYDNKLREQVDVAEALADLYNKLLDLAHPLGERATGDGQDPASWIDVDQIKRDAKNRGEALADSLVGEVESQTSAGIIASKRAKETLAPFLKELKSYSS